MPTVETALLLLAQDDLSLRLKLLHRFHANYWLFKNSVLEYEEEEPNEPKTTCLLKVTQSFVDLCTLGYERPPAFSANFPARILETKLEWDDLILDDYTKEQLAELQIWLESGKDLFTKWNLGKRIKSGYRCLFFGPPGTGKTLTATLLGKLYQLQVYRGFVDGCFQIYW